MKAQTRGLGLDHEGGYLYAEKVWDTIFLWHHYMSGMYNIVHYVIFL